MENPDYDDDDGFVLRGSRADTMSRIVHVTSIAPEAGADKYVNVYIIRPKCDSLLDLIYNPMTGLCDPDPAVAGDPEYRPRNSITNKLTRQCPYETPFNGFLGTCAAESCAASEAACRASPVLPDRYTLIGQANLEFTQNKAFLSGVPIVTDPGKPDYKNAVMWPGDMLYVTGYYEHISTE